MPLASREGIDLTGSYAYSDSITDEPMLRAVGHPVAVNPDRDLARVARAEGWGVENFEHPVRLRDRMPVPALGPSIAVGGVLAAAGGVATWWWLRHRTRDRVSHARGRAPRARTGPALGGPGLGCSGGDGRQASRTFRATVTPIATRIRRTSNFFMRIPLLRVTAGCRPPAYPRPTAPETTAPERRRGGAASRGRAPMSTPRRPLGPEPGVLYVERLSASPRSWVWLLVAAGVTFFAIGPVIVPLTLVAWLINVARYANSSVRIDADRVWVGKRSARLAALDLSTLGRASNTWPWRSFNARYLGANPIWTRDSVGIRGVDGGQTYWVSVGTNRRDELVAVLVQAIGEARARAESAANAYAGDAATAAGMARRSVAAGHTAALVGRHPVDELHDARVPTGGTCRDPDGRREPAPADAVGDDRADLGVLRGVLRGPAGSTHPRPGPQPDRRAHDQRRAALHRRQRRDPVRDHAGPSVDQP